MKKYIAIGIGSIVTFYITRKLFYRYMLFEIDQITKKIVEDGRLKDQLLRYINNISQDEIFIRSLQNTLIETISSEDVKRSVSEKINSILTDEDVKKNVMQLINDIANNPKIREDLKTLLQDITEDESLHKSASSSITKILANLFTIEMS